MRRLLQSLVVMSVTPVAVALPVVGRAAPRPHPVAPQVLERAVSGVDARAVDGVPGWGAAGPATARPVAATGTVPARPFSALGVTWAGEAGEVEVTARVRQDGRWTAWHALDADGDHGPDDTNAADNGAALRGGTAPWFTGPADAYQVRVGVLRGVPPRDLRVSLVDPGKAAADGSVGAAPTLSSGASAEATLGRPTIVTRAQWGADESIRRDKPDYGDTIRMGFVHHTDTTNSYSSSQSAALIRSVYAYHVKSRGWSDIGYNFLVDKYGRIFEGRYGGVDRPVIGAHTGGFNTDTFGVALLGTYTSVVPTSGELAALERTFAWKMGLHYVNPLARTTLTSRGGTKYAEGTRVTFNNVSGHRDAGLTSCPGTQTYNRLPTIRKAIKTYMGASLYAPTISATRATYLTTSGVTVKAGVAGSQSWRLTARNVRLGATVRTISGTASTAVSAVWNLRNGSNVPVPPDTYSVTLESWTSKTRAKPYVAKVVISSPLPDGVAVSGADGVPYALLDRGQLLRTTPALARAVRQQPSVVAYAPQLTGRLKPYAAPRDGLYARSAASGIAYLIVDGARRPVDEPVAKTLGLGTPRTLPSDVLRLVPAGPAWTITTRHPDGAFVRTGATGDAWRIESGVRRPFTSPASRAAWARSVAWAEALPGDLALPVGAPLAPPEGVVLRTGTGAGVVSDGAFRPLSDPAALGYDVTKAALATSADLSALPVGETVEGPYRPAGTLLRSGSVYVEVAGTTWRYVAPSLLGADPRVALAVRKGELTALSLARWVPPSGLAGVGTDGVVRVVESGRVVALPAQAAVALGYAGVSLPLLDHADLGPLPSGSLVNAAAHPAGSVVTDGTSSWLLDAGTRRPLAASLVKTWLGRPALPATDADLALPVGAVAPPWSGAWVVTGDGARWLVYDGARRGVSTAVAHRLGLDKVTPLQVAAADLKAATVAGSPVP